MKCRKTTELDAYLFDGSAAQAKELMQAHGSAIWLSAESGPNGELWLYVSGSHGLQELGPGGYLVVAEDGGLSTYEAANFADNFEVI